MNLGSSIKVAFKALGKNKFRSFLTMLGIIIGVAAVIAMQAIGSGSSSDINTRISSLGSNLIMVTPAASKQSGVRLESGSAAGLKKADADILLQDAPSVAAVSPMVRTSVQLKYGNENWRSNVTGVYPDYFTIRGYEVGTGAVFTEEDEHALAKVCVIGKTVSDNLFGPQVNPVGKTIRVGTIPFLVTGLLKTKGSGFGQDQDDIVVAPFSTVQRRMLGTDNIQQIYLSAQSEDLVNACVGEITQIMRTRHRIPDGAADDFTIGTQSQVRETLNAVLGTITILLASIAAISLLVGGIGIMNIMLVSVTERTREIGIRMAVGATGFDVQFQLLIEAIVLSVLGGIAGITIGVGASLFISKVVGWTTLISPQSILLSFVVSTLIGVFFGWYPARKAANLNPIDALRYE
jgi:putative ABC transport system permease protein